MSKRNLSFTLKVVITLLILVIIQSQIICLTQVYKWSMYTTLAEGDVLISEKVSYRFKSPQEGDVIIFIVDDLEGLQATRTGILVTDYYNRLTNKPAINRYIKRVIATEGDIVELIEGEVVVNGEILEEPYKAGSTYPVGSIQFPYEVPEGQVFLLGDNRENSLDSRSLGGVEVERIESRVICRIWPLSKFGSLDR